MGFNTEKISQLYPEAENLMFEPTLIWKLPPEKKFKLSEVCSSGEYFLEEKIDGAFYQFVRTKNYSYLFGRTVSKTTGLLTEKISNVPHIKKALSCLPPNTIVIGEIYVPGGTSRNVTEIMGCLPELAIKRQENHPIHYYLHDIIMYDNVELIKAGAEDRYNILAAIWEKYNLSQYPFLRLAAKVDTELEAEISRILKNGGEGAVLKKRDCPYVPGKRPAWSTLKIKQMDSVDLVCMGFCNPTREYTGKELDTWIYWEETDNETGSKRICDGTEFSDLNRYRYDAVTKPYALGWKTAIEVGAYDDDRKLIKVGTVSSGLTDEMRSGMAEHPENYLNMVVTLDCMSIDKKSMTLRHPALRCWREDKDAKDCVLKEIFD